MTDVTQATGEARTAPAAAKDLSFRYVHDDGRGAFAPGPRRADRPRAGAAFSVDRLAVYFGVAGLSRDLHPIAPWVDDRRDRVEPPRPRGTSDVGELPERFRAAVAGAMGDHDCVAVAMSGGMDSAALVNAASDICLRDGRRLVLLTLDITDDTGRRAGSTARTQRDFLRVEAEHVRVSPSLTRWPSPQWCATGPRFDAWPRWHHALVLEAAEREATLVLQGAGADQLLQSTPYLDLEFARRRMWRHLRRFRDDDREGTLVTTLLGASGVVRGQARNQLYWATVWPGFTTDRGAPVLHPDREPVIRSWLRSFLDESMRATLRVGPTWAQGVLMHRLFPYDVLDEVGPLPCAMPFLDPEFAEYAYHLPLTARYSPNLPSAYLRSKALVMSLLPDGFEQTVAHERQRFYQTYRRYWQANTRSAVLGEELGLLRAGWRGEVRDSFDLAMVMNCEDWLAGALEHGATPLGVSSAR